MFQAIVWPVGYAYISAVARMKDIVLS